MNTGRPFYVDEQLALYQGDALAVLRTLPTGSVNAVVTSPPYYGLLH
jgi:DNA modification methylase